MIILRVVKQLIQLNNNSDIVIIPVQILEHNQRQLAMSAEGSSQVFVTGIRKITTTPALFADTFQVLLEVVTTMPLHRLNIDQIIEKRSYEQCKNRKPSQSCFECQ